MQSSDGLTAGLTVSDLAVERGGRMLLAGLSFTVAPGVALAVTGENGVGKSTLLRTLAGLLKPSAGTVTLPFSRSAGEGELGSVGERAHYLGHANGQKAALTAAENLSFQQRWLDVGTLTPTEALDAVGLRHCADIPTGLLSAGQKRRVALAGLLVATRPLWLLDEPATALDQASEAILVRLLRDHLATGGIAVVALHAPLDLPVATLRLGHA